jgi:hypothetical protein
MGGDHTTGVFTGKERDQNWYKIPQNYHLELKSFSRVFGVCTARVVPYLGRCDVERDEWKIYHYNGLASGGLPAVKCNRNYFSEPLANMSSASTLCK